MEAMGTARTLAAMELLVLDLKKLDWAEYFVATAPDEDSPIENSAVNVDAAHSEALGALLTSLMDRTQEVHFLICDAFLNHQAHIANTTRAS